MIIFSLIQFTKRNTNTNSNTDSGFDDPASFQAKRSKFLEQQRELEKKRNEEEDYVVKTQRFKYISKGGNFDIDMFASLLIGVYS